MAYATLAELRSYLDVGAIDTGNDALLTSIIARAQKLVDGWCGWAFEASAAATRTYDAILDVQDGVLYLDEPLLTLTTLTNGDGTVLTAAKYFLEPSNTTPKWRVRLRSSQGEAWTYSDDHEQAISVAGTWGYMATADATITQACVRWAAYLYRQKDSQVFDVTAQPSAGILTIPKGIPKDVEIMLQPYRRLC